MQQAKQRAANRAGTLSLCEVGQRELGLLSLQKDHCREPNFSSPMPMKELLRR